MSKELLDFTHLYSWLEPQMHENVFNLKNFLVPISTWKEVISLAYWKQSMLTSLSLYSIIYLSFKIYIFQV